MIIARTIPDLRAALDRVSSARAPAPRAATATAADRIALVPTMGALHAGHAGLFAAARRESSLVVASVFVNPRQFDDPADLAAYPRPEAADAEVARRAGVDLLFVPGETDIYPQGDVTVVDVGGPALGFEGAARPGHFRGVATVCLKLFHLTRPDAAYFGQKDAQQVAVIRQLVRDVHLNLDIRVVPTVRDDDGVALSSRNARLSPEERRQARRLPKALQAAVAAATSGADPVAAVRQELAGLDVEYAGIAPFPDDPTLVIAVKVGTTRLIDNVPLGDPARAGLSDSAS